MSSTPPIPHKSYEELRDSRARVDTTPDLLRIRWRPFGALESSVFVIDDINDIAKRSPKVSPYLTPTSNDHKRTFHPISSRAATDPPVSSITVTPGDMDGYAEWWDDVHFHCDEALCDQKFDPPEDEDVPYDSDGSMVDIELPHGRLIHCCDEDAPPDPWPHTVTVRATTEDYVTIHDFVTQVHPWLQQWKTEIVKAITFDEPEKFRADMYLVQLTHLDCLGFIERDDQYDWVSSLLLRHLRYRDGNGACLVLGDWEKEEIVVAGLVHERPHWRSLREVYEEESARRPPYVRVNYEEAWRFVGDIVGDEFFSDED